MTSQPQAVPRPIVTVVPDYVQEFLLRIVEGWSPAKGGLGPVKSLRLSGVDFSDVAPQIKLVDDYLVVALRQAHVHPRLGELLPFRTDHDVEGDLDDGGTFKAGDISRISLSADLTIDTTTWTVLLDSSEHPLWIGRIEGNLTVTYGGNLVVERVRKDGLRCGHACHFRLSGSYTYYVVQQGERDASIWHLVVDAGAALPDRDLLERDFQILQFVVGCQLRLATLSRVAPDGRTVGMMAGLGTRRNLHPRSVPPVPINRDNDDYVDESWPSLLFDRASATLAARPEARTAFWMAFDAYLDSMSQHIDGDYLRLQVGLEALAYWILRLANEGERMVVKDKAAWTNWTKGNAGAIRALAANGFEETLYQRVMGVYRLSSGRIVPSAFLAHDLPLTEDLQAELEQRNVVVHQGLMAPDGYDADRDFRRVAMIRTLLVALIAKAVSYNGAINGWDVGQAGRTLQPIGWWHVHEDDRRSARQVYFADDTERATTSRHEV